MSQDDRRSAPATARNRDPILAVLRQALPARGLILEIASGTGEHVAHFAASLPALEFQPSDPDPTARASIDAWARSLGLANVRPAIHIDATAPDWPIGKVAGVIAINMIHIAPWEAALGLFRGGAAVLSSGGLLALYGPFREGGRHTAPSNAAFDEWLHGQDARWGVRDLEAVAETAAAAGFSSPEVVRMPANNLTLLFRRI